MMMSNKSAQLVNRLREIRESRGLTQEQLAAKLRTTTATISRWENAQRWFSSKQIGPLSEALDCLPSDIFGPPQESVAQNEEELNLLRTYRGMSDSARSSYKQVGAALAQQSPPVPTQTILPVTGDDLKKDDCKKTG